MHVESVNARLLGTGNVRLTVISDHQTFSAVQLFAIQKRLKEAYIRLAAAVDRREINAVKKGSNTQKI